MIVIYTGLLLPFSTFLLVTFFRTFPRALLEAARIDGAGTLRTFLSVIVPLSRPGADDRWSSSRPSGCGTRC